MSKNKKEVEVNIEKMSFKEFLEFMLKMEKQNEGKEARKQKEEIVYHNIEDKPHYHIESSVRKTKLTINNTKDKAKEINDLIKYTIDTFNCKATSEQILNTDKKKHLIRINLKKETIHAGYTIECGLSGIAINTRENAEKIVELIKPHVKRILDWK